MAVFMALPVCKRTFIPGPIMIPTYSRAWSVLFFRYLSLDINADLVDIRSVVSSSVYNLSDIRFIECDGAGSQGDR